VVRVVRVFSLGRSSNPLRENRSWMQLYSFMLVTLFVVHCAASVFGAIENLPYVTSLYWTSATMTSVGYGDVLPEPRKTRTGGTRSS
jgi:voltage-gated potassium channel Kch